MFTHAEEINNLKDTIEDMISDDYVRRYKAEYNQVNVRIKRLADYIKHYTSNDSIVEQHLKAQQLEAMLNYRNILELRAAINGITLDKE